MPAPAYSFKQRAAGILASGGILALVGALSIWARQPWLAPSLASALFVQTLTPGERSARLWPTLAGQIAGVACGVAGVYLAHAVRLPSFVDHHALLPRRVVAVLTAVVLTGASQLMLRAVSPAGAATTLIVAMGIETADLAGAARLIGAIVVAGLLGEAARLGILKLR